MSLSSSMITIPVGAGMRIGWGWSSHIWISLPRSPRAWSGVIPIMGTVSPRARNMSQMAVRRWSRRHVEEITSFASVASQRRWMRAHAAGSTWTIPRSGGFVANHMCELRRVQPEPDPGS